MNLLIMINVIIIIINISIQFDRGRVGDVGVGSAVLKGLMKD